MTSFKRGQLTDTFVTAFLQVTDKRTRRGCYTMLFQVSRGERGDHEQLAPVWTHRHIAVNRRRHFIVGGGVGKKGAIQSAGEHPPRPPIQTSVQPNTSVWPSSWT